jgi:uncharacterized membrane protein
MRLNTPWRSLVLLGAALAACLGLLGLRFLFTGHFSHFFLVWNLFLGLVPLGLAFVALFVERQNWRLVGPVLLVGLSVLWLIFLPNSSYIFTDFIHLIQRGLGGENPNARGIANMLVWFDVIIRSLFAFVGHFMGLASLYVMHSLWKKEFGRWAGWGVVGFSCWAAGYGIFIGRFVRWNSWNLFTHPEESWGDLVENLAAPDALLFSGGFAVFLLVSYFFLYVFKKHLFTSKEHP